MQGNFFYFFRVMQDSFAHNNRNQLRPVRSQCVRVRSIYNDKKDSPGRSEGSCDEGARWWGNKDAKKGESKARLFKYKKPLFSMAVSQRNRLKLSLSLYHPDVFFYLKKSALDSHFF